MKPAVVFLSLLTTACVGSITGGDTDPPNPPPPPPPPPPAADVTLRVVDGAVPQAGVKVIFQGADDSVIADVVTGADGTAVAKMPDGGNVTVIRTYKPNLVGEKGPIDHVYTYTGVKPGETIELAGALHDEQLQLAAITVGTQPGAIIGVMTPCGSGYGMAPRIILELRGCGPATDFFVVDYSGDVVDDGNGNPINTGPLYLATHATIAPEMDLSAEPFRGTLSTESRVTNTMAAVALQKRLFMGTFQVFDSGTIPAVTATVEVPELPSTEQIVTAYVQTGGGIQMISQRAAFSSSPVTIDGSSEIPSSSAPVLSGDTLSWSQSGTGTPDLAIASITVGAVDRQFTRTVAAAYGGTSMRIPALPSPHDRYNVQPSDTPAIAHNLVSVTGGYEGARARVFNHALADLAPMGGTATVTYVDDRTPVP